MIGISKMFSELVSATKLFAPKSELPESARVCDYVNGIRVIALSISESFSERECLSEHAVVVGTKIEGFSKDASLSGAMMMGDKAQAHSCLSFAAIADDGRVNVLE